MEDKQVVAPNEIEAPGVGGGEEQVEDRRTRELLERHVKNADMSEDM